MKKSKFISDLFTVFAFSSYTDLGEDGEFSEKTIGRSGINV